MIVDKIKIKIFRGFNNVEFELGNQLTLISGQNGTQKTTILGMLSQPFTITDDKNPMYAEKPLCGGNFKSSFADKFKFSEKFDKPKEHEWTLIFNKRLNLEPYTVESILRDKKSNTIRLWKKGDRSKGSGFIQMPVIYLSLKRLFPIGEDDRLKEDDSVVLTDEEIKFFNEWHNKILIITRENDKITSTNYLSSSNKQTLGANTAYYDWKLNSAGQDNISKILLSILSFKRLKERYPNDYKGGILAIDEIDTTFYTGSQIKLIDALIKFASDFNIQIIATTHSLSMIEKVSKIREQNSFREKQVRIMFLKKIDGKVEVDNDVRYDHIKSHLNVTLEGVVKNKKIDVFTEDKEAIILSKALLKRKCLNLNFVGVKLGCNQLIDLVTRKIPSFVFPNSIIILDGDVRSNAKQMAKVERMRNVLLLPTEKSPEQLLAKFLNDLSESSSVWKEINASFSHQYCFQTYSNDEIQNDREKAKKWFNEHISIWGRNATKVINPWIKENKDLVDAFVDSYMELYNKFADEKG